MLYAAKWSLMCKSSIHSFKNYSQSICSVKNKAPEAPETGVMNQVPASAVHIIMRRTYSKISEQTTIRESEVVSAIKKD